MAKVLVFFCKIVHHSECMLPVEMWVCNAYNSVISLDVCGSLLARRLIVLTDFLYDFIICCTRV